MVQGGSARKDFGPKMHGQADTGSGVVRDAAGHPVPAVPEARAVGIEAIREKLRAAEAAYGELDSTFLAFSPGLGHVLRDDRLRNWREQVMKMGAQVRQALALLDGLPHD